MLNNQSIQTKSFREKFFFDLCHLLCEVFFVILKNQFFIYFTGWNQILN